MTIVARSTQGQRLGAELRSVLASLNANLPIVTSVTFEQYAALGLVPQRMAASVSGSLGLVGLLLAAMGIYGVTAYRVTSRTRRSASASRRRPASRRRADGAAAGAAPRVRGVAIGLGLAAVAARLLESLLFGVTHRSGRFVGSAGLFVVIALAHASSRRAAR